jgi:ammonia channel protein AmtB
MPPAFSPSAGDEAARRRRPQGGIVIHTSAGMGALVVAMYIGQRKDFFLYEGPRRSRALRAPRHAHPG